MAHEAAPRMGGPELCALDPSSPDAEAAIRLIARRVLRDKGDERTLEDLREVLFGRPHGVGRGAVGVFVDGDLKGVIEYLPNVQYPEYTEIEYIAVDESAGRQKLGTALVRFVEERAAEAGSVGVVTYPIGDGPALFEHLGYVPSTVLSGFLFHALAPQDRQID